MANPIDQLDQCEQILGPEMSAPRRKSNKWIRRSSVGPADRDQLKLPLLIVNVDAIFAPGLILLANSNLSQKRRHCPLKGRLSSFLTLIAREPSTEAHEIHCYSGCHMLQTRFGLSPVTRAA